MDVAKYIGLFLHKHQYCYLPNLGNFTVSKKPAVHKDDAIEAPEYEVNFSFSKGSIDDALANFIATNERISIANAANAIREFCSHTRESLENGAEVHIPGFGKFAKINGQNQFVSDKQIQVQARNIPFFKTGTPHVTAQPESISSMYEKMQLKEPKTDEEIVLSPPTVNWGKIVLVSILALVVLGLLATAYWYFTKDADVTKPEVTKVDDAANKEVVNPDNNTNTNNATTTATGTGANSGMTNYVINNYADQASAERRVSKLQSYGHNSVSMLAKDGRFLVLYPLNAALDSTKAKDSLATLFGAEVFIVR